MKKTKTDHYTEKEALDFHSNKKPGKIEIVASKNMTTKRDLALAYSPGVAAPVKAISENPETAYDYTAKGNLVAVISNGSAIPLVELYEAQALPSNPFLQSPDAFSGVGVGGDRVNASTVAALLLDHMTGMAASSQLGQQYQIFFQL